MRWQRLFLSLPQFITKNKRERIVEIAKVIVKVELALIYLGHSVSSISLLLLLLELVKIKFC